jgi:nicotinamidase-related amidase
MAVQHGAVVGESRVVQALVVVDVQAAFVSGPGAVPAAEELMVAVKELLRGARESGALVVQLQNDGPVGAVDEPGSPGWELFLPVAPRCREVVVRKTADDGFHGTDLAGLLADHGIKDLVVCGVMSEMCVSATVRSALALGYHVVLPHDSHATYNIPAAEGIAESVPHAMVSRVAEWALGDEVDVIARAEDVRFEP